MIRRILRAELSDVRAAARNMAHRGIMHWSRNVYLSINDRGACAMLGPGSRGWFGAGCALDDPDVWPDGARMLTIGRVTLAAWGWRPS